jgi:hypothetical protein
MGSSFNNFVESTKEFVLKYPIRKVNDNPTYYAVIVEPRKHRNFEYVCKNILRFTGEHWGLHIFHGTQNEAFVKSALRGVSNVIYTNLGVANLNTGSYNNLLSNPNKFYDKIKSDYFLVFQTDACLLREGIDEFMQYDYVGAPWDRNRFGNGGLSIRSKKMCIQICKTYKRRHNEDSYFSHHMKQEKANLPTRDKAAEFSIENCAGRYIPIGVHKHGIKNVKIPNFNNVYRKIFEGSGENIEYPKFLGDTTILKYD